MKAIDRYIAQFRRGTISRREFVNRLLVLGVGLPTITAVLSQHAPKARRPSSRPSARSAAAGCPIRRSAASELHD